MGRRTMPERLSPEHERYVQDALSNGTFRSRREVLDAAVRLLTWREQSLERLIGGSPACDGDGFAEFFDEVHALGRARYKAGRGST